MLRVFKGYNEDEVNIGLEIIENLMQKYPKDVNKQIEEFYKITHKSRRTFFGYKSFLKRKRDTIGNQKYQKYRGDTCYFCGKNKCLIVHHLNFIHSDNRELNLLTLCTSCHVKIHLVAQKVA